MGQRAAGSLYAVVALGPAFVLSGGVLGRKRVLLEWCQPGVLSLGSFVLSACPAVMEARVEVASWLQEGDMHKCVNAFGFEDGVRFRLL